MTPSLRCTSCGTELDTADRYCPSCGRETAVPASSSKLEPCPLCGQGNDADAATCSTCGARIGKDRTESSRPVRSTSPGSGGPSFFQSWKFTAAAGVLLVIGLVIFVAAQGEPEKVTAVADPHDSGMINEIRELQSRLDANPGDQDAMLQLANRLYDVQFFDRAAVMYENYLRFEPGNLDARVDLGTSYFQMSFSDTARHESLQHMAENSFLEAVRADPKHQLANFNLGIIHLHKGDMEGARGWFEKCISIDPESEAAKRAKQLLSQHLSNNPS